MATCLITGGAGFIGAHIAARLLDAGHAVVAIDRLTTDHRRVAREAPIDRLRQRPGFRLIEADLLTLDLDSELAAADYVFHLAGRAGVRTSWGESFEEYTRANILTTQALLEAATGQSLHKFVYASSSSVYGDAASYPTAESTVPRPLSPYGVTKLAGEHLAHLYWHNHGVPVVTVRYFSVYGPGQRSDMAFYRFLDAIAAGRPLTIYGDGEQTRDFTFVSDAVEGTLAAAWRGEPGAVFNIGGGSRVTVNEVVRTLGIVTGRPPRVEHAPAQAGDVRHTAADIRRAREVLGYQPRVDLATGLRAEWEWYQRG